MQISGYKYKYQYIHINSSGLQDIYSGVLIKSYHSLNKWDTNNWNSTEVSLKFII